MSRDLAHIAELLDRDVARTLGDEHRCIIHDEMANVAVLDIQDPDELLVEHVQQFFHDTFVDTTWPACPRHLRHPLWYRDGAWWCTQDHAAIIALGELSQGPGPAG